MTPEMKHDLLLLVVWPVATALLNGLIAWAGKQEHPLAQFLARVGTVAMQKKQEK